MRRAHWITLSLGARSVICSPAAQLQRGLCSADSIERIAITLDYANVVVRSNRRAPQRNIYDPQVTW